MMQQLDAVGAMTPFKGEGLVLFGRRSEGLITKIAYLVDEWDGMLEMYLRDVISLNPDADIRLHWLKSPIFFKKDDDSPLIIRGQCMIYDENLYTKEGELNE